ncbi:hypothetical protein [Pleionea sp. CnH1-48]|uniref:hypothetical protein n=1 Tax=Pleionea sp. CnH1-48 TaxID=2954494 RepID=UPI0020971E8D|nr:hypothetical protein [Pleionea sp. CnH1-48]MCO7226653.1 hypothetical protein [Pleionea sp. CnH1-48]
MKENKEKIRAVSMKSSINESDLKVLQDKVDHLSLVCQAMCELLEQVGFDKTMLAKKIQEIDLRDGKLDGKFSQKKTCPQCERVVAARHIRCLFCGTETP